MPEEKRIETVYAHAREQYAAAGVDTEEALRRLAALPISLPCWQGDDVAGFESDGARLSGGGIQATGRYPGRARTPEELRADVEAALRLIPGRHRLNLHACYREHGGRPVDRDAIGVEHFQGWIDWAKDRVHGLDFNPTFFSHPRAADGFTLSHPDRDLRDFWVRHAMACRRIGAEMGRQLGTVTVTNVWVPDGYKDLPADRAGPRARLAESLDRIFAEPLDRAAHRDAVESKLFGIGAESYTVGSHEFYFGYAVARRVLLCLDTGHFHPTESVADKITPALMFCPGLLLHLSRPVRWDSDHVVLFDDMLADVARELVRADAWDRVHLGLDFFDASINRIAAWVIGARSTQKALLQAWLEPVRALAEAERRGDYTARLAGMEESRTRPLGAVWEEFCRRMDVSPGAGWLDDVRRYERDVLNRRA